MPDKHTLLRRLSIRYLDISSMKAFPSGSYLFWGSSSPVIEVLSSLKCWKSAKHGMSSSLLFIFKSLFVAPPRISKYLMLQYTYISIYFSPECSMDENCFISNKKLDIDILYIGSIYRNALLVYELYSWLY